MAAPDRWAGEGPELARDEDGRDAPRPVARIGSWAWLRAVSPHALLSALLEAMRERVDWRALGRGLPALSLGALLGAAAWLPDADPAAHGPGAARARLARRLGAVALHARRAFRSGHQPRSALLQLALVRERLGDREAAWGLMSRLAPERRPGLRAAHVWMAQRLLRGSAATRRPWMRRRAIRHLGHAVALDPTDAACRRWLARLAWEARRPALVAEALDQAALVQPEVHRERALFYLRWSREPGLTTRRRTQLVARTKQAAAQALPALETALESEPDSLRRRAELAQARLLAGRPAEAVALLETGLQAGPRAAYAALLAGAHVEWARALPAGATAERDRHLCIALGLDPACDEAIAEVILVAGRAGARGDRLLRALIRLRESSQRPGRLDYAIGSAQLLRGRLGPARARLEAAHRAAPDDLSVANNLAWCLAHLPQPDLLRALALVEPAVTRWPGNPGFRDTRGTILHGLQRWAEALGDLRVYLRAHPDDRERHRMAAEACERLGFEDQAAAHRRKARWGG